LDKVSGSDRMIRKCIAATPVESDELADALTGEGRTPAIAGLLGISLSWCR